MTTADVDITAILDEYIPNAWASNPWVQASFPAETVQPLVASGPDGCISAGVAEANLSRLADRMATSAEQMTTSAKQMICSVGQMAEQMRTISDQMAFVSSQLVLMGRQMNLHLTQSAPTNTSVAPTAPALIVPTMSPAEDPSVPAEEPSVPAEEPSVPTEMFYIPAVPNAPPTGIRMRSVPQESPPPSPNTPSVARLFHVDNEDSPGVAVINKVRSTTVQLAGMKGTCSVIFQPIYLTPHAHKEDIKGILVTLYDSSATAIGTARLMLSTELPSITFGCRRQGPSCNRPIATIRSITTDLIEFSTTFGGIGVCTRGPTHVHIIYSYRPDESVPIRVVAQLGGYHSASRLARMKVSRQNRIVADKSPIKQLKKTGDKKRRLCRTVAPAPNRTALASWSTGSSSSLSDFLS